MGMIQIQHERDLPGAGGRGAEAPARAEHAPRIAVVYASKGRAAVLERTVAALAHQSRKPDAVILSCVSREDAGPAAQRRDVELVLGPAGLARQRNAALHHLGGHADIVVFFDDDFVPHPDWLESVERCFRMHRDIVGVTGLVIADGIRGPGLTFEQAQAALDGWTGPNTIRFDENYSPYGCNMAFRVSAIGDLRFDERLVLYGWLEDRDFGGALRKRGGRLVRNRAAAGVHLGIKKSRASGRQLGYSQIINPIYLHRKGTMTLPSLAQHVSRNLLLNACRSVLPEPHIDRTGRFFGNLLGFKDLMFGRLMPERVSRL